MLTRLVTGVFLALTVSFSILFLSSFAIKILIIFLTAIAAYECGKILLPKDKTSFTATLSFTIICSVMLVSALIFLSQDERWQSQLWLLFPLLFFLLLVFHIFFPGELSQLLAKVTGSLFTVFYCGVLFSFLAFLRELPQGKTWLFFTLACTFSSDTGAFFAGRYLGKHKLAAKVSPNKTIEGFLGGILMSVAVALFMYLFIFQSFPLLHSLAIAILCGTIGPLGDLAESLLKRGAGVKDSGKLIPGHGGLLDRVDALLFSAPAVYIYAYSLST